MNNAGDAVILCDGMLGAVAWVWSTRRWTVVRRVLPLVVFALVWLVFTLGTMRDSRYDPDLGIRLSSLAFADAAIWFLPLALAVWVTLVGVVLLFRCLFRSRV